MYNGCELRVEDVEQSEGRSKELSVGGRARG